MEVPDMLQQLAKAFEVISACVRDELRVGSLHRSGFSMATGKDAAVYLKWLT